MNNCICGKNKWVSWCGNIDNPPINVMCDYCKRVTKYIPNQTKLFGDDKT